MPAVAISSSNREHFYSSEVKFISKLIWQMNRMNLRERNALKATINKIYDRQLTSSAPLNIYAK